MNEKISSELDRMKILQSELKEKQLIHSKEATLLNDTKQKLNELTSQNSKINDDIREKNT